MSNPKDAPNYRAPALEKGLHILEGLAHSPQPLSLVELAALQGKSRNEIFRMVNCLETLGYVMRDDDSGKYSLSLKLHHLSQMQPLVGRIRKTAAVPLQQLAETLNESCHICILEGVQLAVLSQAHPSSRRICLRFDESEAFDPVDSCSGALLLSRLSADVLDAVLEQSPVYLALTPSKRKVLRKRIGALHTRPVHQAKSTIIDGIEDFSTIVGSASSWRVNAERICSGETGLTR